MQLELFANNEPDKIIAVRKDSPLIVGLGERWKLYSFRYSSSFKSY